MTIRTATPYLILYGQAERAIALYRRAFDAQVTALQRFGDVDQSCPEAQRNAVMHAELRLGEALVMLSDGPGDVPGPGGGRVSVALQLDDEAQARRAFDVLASQGTVVEPLFDAPWGDLFGVVHDELGVSWMFSCSKKPG